MSKSGLLHAVIFDGFGSAKEVNYEDINNIKLNEKLLWVHFNYSSSEAIDWITNKSGIDQVAIDALLTEESRPRTTIIDESILLALRGVNLNANSDPEDMISIRLFISENIIISTTRRDLFSVRDILNNLEQKKGPKTASEFIIELTHRLTSRMEGTIAEMEDSASNIEELILSTNNMELRTQISELRRVSISLRRYIFPQKEAMYKLVHDKISWISDYERIQLREITDQLIRYIEELDSIKDKLSIIQEELANKVAEQMNQRMYVLSILSAIFLPLGFLTGLLGINVGGIPGAENKDAFVIFCLMLFGTVVLQLFILKKSKWI